MTSARNRATARTRRVNTALVAGAVFASVGVGSALVGNQIATSSDSSSTASSTEGGSSSSSQKSTSGTVTNNSSSNQSHATSNGS